MLKEVITDIEKGKFSDFRAKVLPILQDRINNNPKIVEINKKAQQFKDYTDALSKLKQKEG